MNWTPSGSEWTRSRARKFFNAELAAVNDYLVQENRILRAKFDQRVPLSDEERKVIGKYAARIKTQLGDIAGVARPACPP